MKVGDGESLLRKTFDRARALPGATDVVTVTNREYLFKTRDEYGRVKQVTTPWWTNEATYVATTGQAKSVTRGTQKLEWLYDGFLMTEEKATGIARATSEWRYDTDFRRAAHRIGGSEVAFAYDGDSLLTQAGAATLGCDTTTGRLSNPTVGSVSAAFGYAGFVALTPTAGG